MDAATSKSEFLFHNIILPRGHALLTSLNALYVPNTVLIKNLTSDLHYRSYYYSCFADEEPETWKD